MTISEIISIYSSKDALRFDEASGALVSQAPTLKSEDMGVLASANLTFNTRATLQFKLNTSRGQGDTINVTGNLTLNNANLVLNDLAASSNALAAGTQFALFTYTGTESRELDYNGTALANDGTFTYGANTYEIQYGVGDK